jgi:ubiquinone/menaquinone biosynthesis C-methylase UbiE
MESVTPYHIPETHPNHDRWTRAADYKLTRGTLILNLVSEATSVSGKAVLDIGFGEGGTSLAFSLAGARVTGVEINLQRLVKFQAEADAADIRLLTANAEALPFADASFDLVILQDVIEHCETPDKIIAEISRVLKTGGRLYLSTPNKFSVLNFISDSHWGLPFVSVMSRRRVNFFLMKVFHRHDIYRTDAAQLLSLGELQRLFERHGFALQMLHRRVVKELFQNPKSLVWAAWHLKTVALMKRLRLEKVISRFVSDKPSVFNKILNPTFYFLLTKV